MAVVGRITSAEVAPQAIPNARLQSNLSPNYAAGLTQGIDKLGGVVEGIFQQAQEKADMTQVLEAERKVSDYERTLTDRSNPNSMYAAKGKDALEYVKGVVPDYDAIISEQVGTIRSPKAQQAFMARMAGRRNATIGQLDNYAGKEVEAYEAAEFKSGIANNAQETAQAGIDGRLDDMGMYFGQGASIIRAQTGLPPATIQEQLDAYESSVHTTIIKGKAEGGDEEGAMEWRTKYDRDISPEMKAQIDARLQPAILQASSVEWLDTRLGGGQTFSIGPGAGTDGEVVAAARAAVPNILGRETIGGTGDAAKNPTSSAEGRGQFINATWYDQLSKQRPELVAGVARPSRANKYYLPPHVVALKRDPHLATAMTEAYAIENAKAMKAMGVPVTDLTVYLAHHFGIGGVRDLSRANPNALVKNVLGAEAVAANGYLKDFTVQDLFNKHSRGGAVAASATQGPTPRTATGKVDWSALEQEAMTLPRKMRNQVLPEIAMRRGQEERQERQSDEAAIESMQAAVMAAPPGTPLNKALSVDQMAVATQKEWVGGLRTMAINKASNTLAQTDLLVFDKFLEMSQSQPEVFMHQKVAILNEPNLSRADRETLLNRVNALNDPKKAGAAMQDYATEAQRVDQVAASLNVGSDQKEKRAAISLALQARERALTLSRPPDQKISPAERDQFAAAVKTSFSRDIANGRDPYALSRNLSNVRLSITPQDQERARAGLRDEGNKTPSQTEIENYVYGAMQESAK